MEIDLFDQYESLPMKVRRVIEKAGDVQTYDQCSKLVKALNKVGYTCECYLDAMPFNLKKL